MNKATILIALVIAVLPLVSSVTGSETRPAEGGSGRAESPADAYVRQALAKLDGTDGGRRTDVHVAWSDRDAEHKVTQFLGSHSAHSQAIRSLQQCRNCHSGTPTEWLGEAGLERLQPKGPWIGVSVVPADGVLRSQLRLPEGTGVVVTQVVPDGPARQAGVEVDDVLLSVNGKPIAAGEDLDRVLEGAAPDGPPLVLKVVHDGATVEKRVTPRAPEATSFIQSYLLQAQPTYRIGVQVSDPDQTLRRQLKLGDAGLVVSEVKAGSPAEGAGVKVGDVLLSVNGQRLTEQQELTDAVVKAAETPVELELMRGGVTLKISVTPAKETAAATNAYLSLVGREADSLHELMLVHPTAAKAVAAEEAARWMERVEATRPTPLPAEDRLRQITEQLDQLRAAVDALRDEMGRGNAGKGEGAK